MRGGAVVGIGRATLYFMTVASVLVAVNPKATMAVAARIRMRFSKVISEHPNMMCARGLQVVKVAGGDGGKVGPGRYSKHLALRVRSWTKYGRSYRSVSADIFTII